MEISNQPTDQMKNFTNARGPAVSYMARVATEEYLLPQGNYTNMGSSNQCQMKWGHLKGTD